MLEDFPDIHQRLIDDEKFCEMVRTTPKYLAGLLKKHEKLLAKRARAEKAKAA